MSVTSENMIIVVIDKTGHLGMPHGKMKPDIQR